MEYLVIFFYLGIDQFLYLYAQFYTLQNTFKHRCTVQKATFPKNTYKVVRNFILKRKILEIACSNRSYFLGEHYKCPKLVLG